MLQGKGWLQAAREALQALGGEADEAAILRWIEKNRPGWKHSWRQPVLSALRDNADGGGFGLFRSLPKRPGYWHLAQETRNRDIANGYGRAASIRTLVTSRSAHEARRLMQFMVEVLFEPGAGGSSALERYLLAVVAYELGHYTHAVTLCNASLAAGLEEEYQLKAERLREICVMKAEA